MFYLCCHEEFDDLKLKNKLTIDKYIFFSKYKRIAQ